VDLRSRDPARDDLGQAGSWGVRRVIRAEVLTALLLGASRPEPGQAPAIRLRGAPITGRLVRLHPGLADPFGALGLRQAYGANGAGQWLSYALIASGWILATAVIAGITSAVRRD